MCKPIKEFVKSGKASLKLIISLTVIVVGAEVIIAILIWFSGDWFLGGSRQTFGPLHNYGFIWLSIVIASIAALNSWIMSHVASKSLELTRATQRPFLTYVVDNLILDESGTASLKIIVSNKGNLPAEKPLLQLFQVAHWSKTGEPSTDTDKLKQSIPEPSKLKEVLRDKKKEPDATYFPGEARPFTFTFGPNMLQIYKNSKCAAMAVLIFYQSMQREYETIRWFLNDKSKPHKLQFTTIPEKDYYK